jgi:hypothetical protein
LGVSAYIVVDSNFIGRGHFNSDKLAALGDRVKFTGAVVIVPEVVIWEWAEHARKSMDDASRAVDLLRRHADASLLMPAVPLEVPEALSLADRISSTVNKMRNVFVEPTTSDAALLALKSQVLLSGEATHRKEGVKTGAADVVVLECLKNLHAQNDLRVILASSDSRLIAAANTEVPGLIVVRSHNELFAAIFAHAPDVVALADYVDAFARGEAGASSGYGLDVRGFPLGYELIPEPDELGGIRQEVSMYRTDLIETGEFVPLTTGEIRMATLDVNLFGTVTIRVWTQESDGSPVSEEHLVNNVKVAVPSLVTFNHAWEPQKLEVTGRARIYLQ